MPLVNWLLMIGCVGLVIGFRTSSNLAAAYGIAVTATMAITTLLFYRVVRDRWNWSHAEGAGRHRARCSLIDLAFLAANIPKIPARRMVPPRSSGSSLVIQMTTWRRGRAIVAQILQRGQRRTDEVVAEAVADGVVTVPGTAIYMFKDPGSAPPAMISNLRHNHVRHETTVVLSVIASQAPRIEPGARVAVTSVTPGVFQVVITFGYMDDHDVLAELRQVASRRPSARRRRGDVLHRSRNGVVDPRR